MEIPRPEARLLDGQACLPAGRAVVTGFITASIVALFFVGAVNVHGAELPLPGVLPTSAFYFLDLWSEAIAGFLNFGNIRPVERELSRALERLAELNVLADRNEFDAFEKTVRRYATFLARALGKAEAIEDRAVADDALATFTEAILQHQAVLLDVHSRASPQAQLPLERAMEVGVRGYERVLRAISKDARMDVIDRLEPIRNDLARHLGQIRDEWTNVPEIPGRDDFIARAPSSPPPPPGRPPLSGDLTWEECLSSSRRRISTRTPRRCQLPDGRWVTEPTGRPLSSPPAAAPPSSPGGGLISPPPPVSSSGAAYSSRYSMRTYTLYSANPADPIAIFIHGGGWRSGDKDSAGYNDSFLDLQQRGYNVYTINYRLSGEAIWPAQINDVKCMLAFLASSPQAVGDPRRIFIWGNSAGAHLTLMAGLTAKDDFDDDCEWQERDYTIIGLAASSPAIDLTRLSAKGLAVAGELLGFSPIENTSQALTASPIYYPSADDPPFLLMTGAKDILTLAEKNGEALKSAFAAIGRPINWINYSTLGHNIGINSPTSQSFLEMVKFINSL